MTLVEGEVPLSSTKEDRPSTAHSTSQCQFVLLWTAAVSAWKLGAQLSSTDDVYGQLHRGLDGTRYRHLCGWQGSWNGVLVCRVVYLSIFICHLPMRQQHWTDYKISLRVCQSVSQSVNFETPFISRERLKLATSNLAHRLVTGGPNEKMQN